MRGRFGNQINTKYKQFAKTLSEEIRSGILVEGTILHINDLVARFNTTNHTVDTSLRILRGEGLVGREKVETLRGVRVRHVVLSLENATGGSPERR